MAKRVTTRSGIELAQLDLFAESEAVEAELRLS